MPMRPLWVELLDSTNSGMALEGSTVATRTNAPFMGAEAVALAVTSWHWPGLSDPTGAMPAGKSRGRPYPCTASRKSTTEAPAATVPRLQTDAVAVNAPFGVALGGAATEA